MPDISSLLATGNSMLTKLVESPIAAPVALAGLSLALKNYAPRLSGGLAQMAVQQVFQPAQQKREMDLMLLNNPNLTTSAPPPGYSGAVVDIGGRKVRQRGTLGQELPSEYGEGVRGTQLQPSADTLGPAMLKAPYMPAAPPPLPMALSRFSLQEQNRRASLGGLPGTQEGQLAATKSLMEMAVQEEQRKREAATLQAIMGIHQKNPGSMGVSIGMGKDGSPTVGLRTLTPRNTPAPRLVPTVNAAGQEVYGVVGPTGEVIPGTAAVPSKGRIGSSKYGLMEKLLTPEEQKQVLMGGGTGKPSRLSELQRLRDEGQISEEQYRQEIMRGDGGYEKIDYREDMKILNQQILAAKKELLSLKKLGGSPERVAPLEAELSSLEDQKKALQQSVEKPSGGGAPASAVDKQKAVSDFIKKAQQLAR